MEMRSLSLAVARSYEGGLSLMSDCEMLSKEEI